MAKPSAAVLNLSVILNDSSIEKVSKQVETSIAKLQKKFEEVKVSPEVEIKWKDAVNKLNNELSGIKFGDVNNDFLAKLFSAKNIKQADEIVNDYVDTLNRFQQFVGTKNIDLFRSFDSDQIKDLFDQYSKLKDNKLFIDVEPDFEDFDELVKSGISEAKQRLSGESIPIKVDPDFDEFNKKVKDEIGDAKIESSDDSEVESTKSSVDINSLYADVKNVVEQINNAYDTATGACRASVHEQENLLNELQEAISSTGQYIEGALPSYYSNATDKIQSNLSALNSQAYKDLGSGLQRIGKALGLINPSTFDKVVRTVAELGSVKIQGSSADNLKSYATALKKVAKDLQDINADTYKGSTTFVKDLKNLLSKTSELSNLSSILKSSQNKINSVDKVTDTQGKIDLDSYKKYKEQLEYILKLKGKIQSAKTSELDEINSQLDSYDYSKLVGYVDELISKSTALTEAQKEELQILKNKIALQEASNEDYYVKQLEATSKTNDEKREEIQLIQSESDEYASVISKLGEYRKYLGNIVSITKSLSGSGNHVSELYTIKNKDGLTLKMNGNGEWLNQRKEILAMQSAYDALTKSQTVYIDNQSKINASKNPISSLYQSRMTELDAATKSLKTYLDQVQSGESIYDVEELNAYVDGLKKATKGVQSLTKAQKGVSDTSAAKLTSKIYDWMNKNTIGATLFNDQLKEILATINKMGPDADLSSMEGQWLKIANAIKEAGLEGNTFWEQIQGAARNSTSQLLAQFLSINDIVRYVKEAVGVIEELDYSLVDLSKTADMTESQLEGFYHSANDTAQAMGVTTNEVIEMASSWSRLGYSSAEAATEMAEITAKFAAISPGMTTDEASTGLISIMKAWQDIEVEDVEREVLDKINSLGNNFALENQDVLDGAQKFAAALSTMGTSYEDAFALFTGAQEVIQDADRVGNGLKTVAMRIRGYSEDVESGEYVMDESLQSIEGDLINLTKIEGELPEGISIYTDETKNSINEADKEYKSLVEYFRELSKYWDKYSETQQTQLLQKLFGKTQSDVWLYVQKCA